MKTKIITVALLAIIFSLLLFSATAWAGSVIPASSKAVEKGRATNSPVITETDGKWYLAPPGLERRVYLLRKRDFARTYRTPSPRSKPGYKLLGKGIKWKSFPINYVINPTNSYNLSESFITSAVFSAAEEWDKYTSTELFGTYTIDYAANWDTQAPDGKNEVVFGNYSGSGVVAITSVWGYFYGPSSAREIIEFDVMLDTDYVWGDATLNPQVMDVQNIATHELGHGVGLDDLYDAIYSEETMYGYTNYGEIKKRDLNTGDIAGIRALYGI